MRPSRDTAAVLLFASPLFKAGGDGIDGNDPRDPYHRPGLDHRTLVCVPVVAPVGEGHSTDPMGPFAHGGN